MKSILVIIALLTGSYVNAQLSVSFEINTANENHPISPLIYGSNGQSADQDENITARRLGGNRLTGYNWENNASNAGSDWYHSSDDYLPWASGLPTSIYRTPNIVYQAFLDTSLSMNCYSLITLPMAGFVARDMNGNVLQSETAPSSRFCSVVNIKGSAFSTFPDTTDQNVYIDECLYNLIQQNGLSNTANGIKGYSKDNEYALWNSTHPRIHPAQPTIAEVISKSVAMARTIKSMDPTADVFGPADYGYASFLNFQSSPDWSSYSSYGNFINAYLNGMKLASDTSGFRLLDVVDVHWYPEAQGMNDQGTLERVVGGSNDRGVAAARMKCPRSLWDSSYVENSWIGQWYSPCVYIHALKNGISTYNPSTKLAFTEFDYGGMDHISGGIAMVDVLGIFGKYDVYMGTHWGPLDDYVSSAYKIFRNFDGNNSTFGDIHVEANTSDVENSSVFASVESGDSTQLHFMVTNKNFDSTMTANFTINSSMSFTSGEIWRFDSTTSTITHHLNISGVINNQFSTGIPPLSVFHIILNANVTTGVDESSRNTIHVFPNPAGDYVFVSGLSGGNNLIRIQNVFGENVLEAKISDRDEYRFNVSKLASEIYFLVIENADGKVVKKFIKR